MENMVSRTLSVHQEHEMLLKLKTAGLTDELAQRVIDSKGNYLAAKVVRLIQNGGFEATTSQKRAREVMGRNYFGIEDWSAFYGATFTKKQLRQVAEFPWGEDIPNGPCPFNKGKLVKDTHFAFLGISDINGQPLTVTKLIELHPATGQPKFYFNNNPWHVGQPHTDVATMQLRWYLLLKDIVPGSTDKTPEEQVAMLPPEYEVPTTIVETSKDILIFRKTGERPNGSRWAACTERTVKTSLPDPGNVSCVGGFDEHGLVVSFWYGDCHDFVGVGASRKF